MSTASISSSTPTVLPTVQKSTAAPPAKHDRGSVPAGLQAATAQTAPAADKTASPAASAATAARLNSSQTSAQTTKVADRQAQILPARTTLEAAAQNGATSGTRIDVKA